ncbi:TPA: AAA family ATPase, partial [Proteus mirabilis]|nr:AAA family ATPase [Proteus mirabilis]HDT4901502.1 AAA family ATPase [Proteus mirabilis]
MYLESFTIKNYRKFGENNNTVYFVNANEICHSPDNNDGEIKPLISPSSTLIIGKNNAGKTTITNALTFITEAKNKPPKSSDFNVYYLKKLLEKYNVAYQENSSFDNLLIPKLEFILKIKIDSSEYNDLITNLSNFITLSNDSLEEPIEIKV